MMHVYEGSSEKTVGEEAVAEAVASWDTSDLPDIDMIFAFHSTCQGSESIAQALHERYPNAQVVGCTTAGEWKTGSHLNRSLVLTGISSPDIRWAVKSVSSLEAFDSGEASATLGALLASLDLTRSDLTPKKHFCIGLFDGLVGVDGAAISCMANELGNTPFIGGMAADDLKFNCGLSVCW
jgi:hypothetical protein